MEMSDHLCDQTSELRQGGREASDRERAPARPVG